MKDSTMRQDDVTITREELVRIAGEETVVRAETITDEKFQEIKWNRLQELVYNCGKLNRTPLFEARRSFLLGLDSEMLCALIRHVLDE